MVVPSGTAGIVCAANWLRTRRVRHVTIIGPTYWTTIHSLKILGIDASIVDKLNAATVAAMNGPGLKEQLDDLAATLVTPERRTPAYLTGFVKAEWDKWGAAIRAGGAIPK